MLLHHHDHDTPKKAFLRSLPHHPYYGAGSPLDKLSWWDFAGMLLGLLGQGAMVGVVVGVLFALLCTFCYGG